MYRLLQSQNITETVKRKLLKRSGIAFDPDVHTVTFWDTDCENYFRFHNLYKYAVAITVRYDRMRFTHEEK